MRPIYKSLALAAMTLQVSVALEAQVNDGTDTSQIDVPAEVLDSLRVELVAHNVSGARDLIKSGECTVSDNVLNISLNTGEWLKGGVYRLQVSATFGTQTQVIYALDVTVPRYDELASDPQEFEDTVTVVSTFGDGQGENDLKSAMSVTYAQLVALRNSGKLVAGQMYRITDYVTTTAAENTQSAGHAFDLIVTALSENVLSEEASAIQHEGDTYFSNCDLAAWKVMYCIDNDTNRFAWADEENGKGVIFRLVDEWRNDLPFDFKNIKFKRWAVTGISHDVESYDTSSLEEAFVYDAENQPIRYGLKGENYQNGRVTFEVEDETDADYYYAFAWVDEQGAILDLSIIGQTLKNDEGLIKGCTDNYCATQYKHEIEEEEVVETLTAVLPNNVIVNTFAYESGLFYGCYSSTFGNGCYSNTFGNYCYSNTFGNDCYSNTFGNDCYSNTFGNDCNSNTFGNDCNSNTFGNSCNSNTFGNSCNSNTFGNGCYSNTFGNGCYSNTFGNYCYSNTFGNYCYSNTFGEGAQNDAVTKDFMRYITLESGVQFVDVTCAATTSGSAYGQNILVHSGVVGTNDARNTCSIDDASNDFLTEFGVVQQGVIS